MGCIASSPNVKVPWALSSLTRYEWLEWRKCFITFMEHKYIPPYKQTNKFFKYLGFLGEEVANDYLYFQESKSEATLKTLLFKFDVYFMFAGITKMDSQSIEEYILLLNYVAEQVGNNKNIEKIVKEKILQDFKQNNIFYQIKSRMLIPSITNYESLALHQLIFLWNVCQTSVETQQDLVNLKNTKNSQKCFNCGQLNHYARCCSEPSVTDCPNCGLSHAQSKCPAFGKTCFKCNEMDHFSKKCNREIIQSCIYCGGSHINDRQKCTANFKKCRKCHRLGHFANMCHKHGN